MTGSACARRRGAPADREDDVEHLIGAHREPAHHHPSAGAPLFDRDPAPARCPAPGLDPPTAQPPGDEREAERLRRRLGARPRGSRDRPGTWRRSSGSAASRRSATTAQCRRLGARARTAPARASAPASPAGLRVDRAERCPTRSRSPTAASVPAGRTWPSRSAACNTRASLYMSGTATSSAFNACQSGPPIPYG